MKSAKIASGLVALSLALVLALVLAIGGHAQGLGGDEKNEEGGAGGLGLAAPAPPGYTVLYMFTGATDNQNGADTAATAVHCTNRGTAPVEVRVEISDFDNVPTISGTAPIPPSYTATFCSQDTSIYDEDVAMSTDDDINQGSGRVLANSSSAKIICTAQVLDPTNNPPTYAVRLKLFDGSGNPVGETRGVYLPIILKSYPTP